LKQDSWSGLKKDIDGYPTTDKLNNIYIHGSNSTIMRIQTIEFYGVQI
jgi:hypothetical protein